MNLSKHDQTLLAITVGVALFGIVLASARRQIDAMRDNRAAVSRLSDRLAMQREMIAARDAWEGRYDAVKDRMPVFSRTDQVSTYWLSIMDAAADEHGLKIIQRSQRDETLVAGVCELPIEVRSWEGTLESLVRFIHALESEGAMLEIRELRVSPIRERQGYLKGSFLLSCAYMRADEATVDANKLAGPPSAGSGEDPEDGDEDWSEDEDGTGDDAADGAAAGDATEDR